MTTETVRCRCGREVALVRLNPETEAYGHLSNPRNQRHPVQLARSGENADPRHPGAAPSGVRSPRPEGLDPSPNPRLDATRRVGTVPAGGRTERRSALPTARHS